MTEPSNLRISPASKTKVPIAKPSLPDVSDSVSEIAEILNSGRLTNGPYTRSFEERVAAHLGVKHAVAVSSGTSGLMLAYRALALTGEVVVPSFTFMATVSAMVWAGLTPVFADVDFATTNLDPRAAEAAITSRTSAIVAVHNSGNPADIAELEALALRRGVRLVFDAAHAFGSLYLGEPVGSQGDMQVFSLSPTKLLTAIEGGIVTTNDDLAAEGIRIGREYGNRGDYDSAFAGLSARMPEVHAWLGKRNLSGLERAAQHRNVLANLYQESLQHLPGISFQIVREGNRNSYKDFSIIVEPIEFGLTRDELAEALAAENIETRKYYDPPVHRQTAYRAYARPGTVLSNTDRLAGAILSLPIWSQMDASIVLRICSAIELAHQNATGNRRESTRRSFAQKEATKDWERGRPRPH